MAADAHTGFKLEKGHPNCIEGNKRGYHTIIPAVSRADGPMIRTGADVRCRLVVGYEGRGDWGRPHDECAMLLTYTFAIR